MLSPRLLLTCMLGFPHHFAPLSPTLDKATLRITQASEVAGQTIRLGIGQGGNRASVRCRMSGARHVVLAMMLPNTPSLPSLMECLRMLSCQVSSSCSVQ